MIETADIAPSDDEVTAYDRAHLQQYLRLLDAHAASASWQEAAEAIFGETPLGDTAKAKRRHDSHLARAQWMAESGYLDLLRSGES